MEQQSRPHFTNANSILSSSAGYTDYASDESSTLSARGYSTPPSRVSTPIRPADMTTPARTYRGPAYEPQPNRRHDPFHEYDFNSPTPGVDDTPYIRFAIEQLTFDEELMGRGRHSSDFINDQQQRQILAPPAPAFNLPPQQSRTEQTQPPQRPFQLPKSSSEHWRPKPGVMLIPADPPRERHQLGFVPTPLRLISLGPLVLLCLLMVVGLIFSNVYALRNHGLYDYDSNFSPRYFVFEYLPPMFGMVIIFWLFIVQAAIYRSAPYFAISKSNPGLSNDRTLQEMPIHPSNFVLPDWRFFRLGEPVIGAILCLFWLSYWTVPLLSCLYGTQYFTGFGDDRFRWTTIQALGWFIMVLYLLLIVALVVCMFRFRRRQSALMWDPTCLADLIILFQRSNILPDYLRSETKEDLDVELPPRYCRLGYWTTNQTSDYFYAVGEANEPYLELSMTNEKTTEKFAGSRTSGESEGTFRHSAASSFARMLHSPWVRHRWCPWFLRDSAVVAWSIASMLLLIAFLVISFVNRAAQRGFLPMLISTTEKTGFSPANFLFSFIPALLGMFLFLAWQPIDIYFRSVQAYVNLAEYDGASARRSVLLSYNSQLPILVTLKALSNRDWKVAHFSLMSVASALIPILAGGVFTALLFSNGEVRMTASMPGYYTLCVILALYAVSYLVIWPTRFRYLPHSINTVSGNLSFLYASRLLKDSAIRNIRTKDDFIARLDGKINTALTGDSRRRRREKSGESRYGFGIYIGIDGKEHLGIDRMYRPGSSDMMVVTSGQTT